MACLSNEEEVHEGKLFMGHVLAVEDGYYEYWVNETYGGYHVDRLLGVLLLLWLLFLFVNLLLGSYALSSAAVSIRGCSAVSSVMGASKQSPVV